MNATTAWRWLVVAWFAACSCPTPPDADPGQAGPRCADQHNKLHNRLNNQQLNAPPRK